MKKKSVAIVLAAGSGKRMESDTPKQYLDLGGRSLVYHSLKAFEETSIEEIILVVGENEVDYNKKHIVEKYNLKKVKKIIVGGSERYLSVYNGLKAIDSADYVLIHDGARPFITSGLIEHVVGELMEYNACVVAVPSKDTIKISNDENVIIDTLDRNYTWIIQTPQGFSYQLIMKAYNKVMEDIEASDDRGIGINITDDAMVVEYATSHKIRLVKGDYSNIKITTPEDMVIGNALLGLLQ